MFGGKKVGIYPARVMAMMEIKKIESPKELVGKARRLLGRMNGDATVNLRISWKVLELLRDAEKGDWEARRDAASVARDTYLALECLRGATRNELVAELNRINDFIYKRENMFVSYH